MTILRFLNVQGFAGIAVSLCLGVLLVLQNGETRHWKKQSEQYEQLYRGEQAAFAGTVANYRAAADAARASDKSNANRVAAEQRAINQRSTNDYQARLAAARARAEQLRRQTAVAAADPRTRPSATMSRLPAAAQGTDRSAGEGRLSPEDALTATEQAIQLEELIKWVQEQAEVDTNGRAPSTAPDGR
jgi:hypothetical protein